MSRTPRRTSLVDRLVAGLRLDALPADPLADGAPVTVEARAFEAALRTATLALVAEPLPPAARLGVVAQRGSVAPPRRLSAAPVVTGVLAVATAVSLLQLVPHGQPGGVGAPVATPVPGTASPSASLSSPSGTGPDASAQPTGPATTRPTPAPTVSPSAPCSEAFAVAVKTWSSTGVGQIRATALDKATLSQAAGALGKVFVVCSPAELRVVNASITLVVPVKVAGATSLRYVRTQLFDDVDRVAQALCRGSRLASTRTCAVELAAPTPASSGSP